MLSKNMCWRCDGTDISEEEMMKCNVCEKAKYCGVNCLRADKYRHKVECDNASAKFHCHGCRKTGENMQQCSNCLTAWFCSNECRKTSWESHKIRCLQVNQRVNELYQKRASEYRVKYVLDHIYYWGNTPAVDLINLPMNEGTDYKNPLKLLLCGVADPRSVCLSLASLPNDYTDQVTFVLNDICLCALARIVLLLYLIMKGGKSKANSVTQIWYSLYLSADDHAFLVSALQDLTRVSNLELITRSIMQVNAEQLPRLKTVWTGWLVMSSCARVGLQEQRMMSLYRDEKAMKEYQEWIPNNLRKSLQEWLEAGVLQDGASALRLTHENVSLTGFIARRSEGVEDLRYCVEGFAGPFFCWDYKAVAKASPESNSLQQLYSNYITTVIQAAAERLVNGEAVKIICMLGDCLNLPHEIPSRLKFDRIATSNLWDYIPLLRLLGAATPLLNKMNPHSVILTETMTWMEMCPQFVLDAGVQAGVPGLFGLPLSNLRQTALNDTGDQAIAYSNDINGFINYYNLLEYILDYLRACLLPASEPIPKFLPSLKKLAEAQGLILRDPTQLENSIVPFRYGINYRKPTRSVITSTNVEWILDKR